MSQKSQFSISLLNPLQLDTNLINQNINLIKPNCLKLPWIKYYCHGVDSSPLS